MLCGSAWRRLFPRIWVLADYGMSDRDWISAASLAMPGRAQLSHLTRIRALGLNHGPLRPFHFTVSGDLHLSVPDVFLHRTEVLPPTDDIGVTPAAAFIQFCATARAIDAIVVGDWLLNQRHMSVPELADLALRDLWRPGARQAQRILSTLDPASRSPKESECRAVVVFAGLPRPEANVPLIVGNRRLGVVDLLIRRWMLVLEYEGRQHAETIDQFNIDIARYSGFRDAGIDYIQVTQEILRQPRALALRIHRKLIERGYDGPAPVFASRWHSLFEPIGVLPGSAVG